MSALPHGMANGPSRNEHLEHEDAQIWERPWSLEEIRQHSANWSLAADSGVSLMLSVILKWVKKVAKLLWFQQNWRHAAEILECENCNATTLQLSCFLNLCFSLQLFHFLQDFSQRMMSKTHEIEKQLDSLLCDTKATDSRLHSVFNDFLMLSNTQFIENVMYFLCLTCCI